MEQYIKYELFGGESPRHCLNLFIVAKHNTYINTCYIMLQMVSILTITMLNIIMRTYHTMLLLFIAPMNEHYCFLQGLGNIAQGDTTADIVCRD